MVNSIKLYADNLLCMDLCCWPQGDAAELLGEEVSIDRQTDVLIVDKHKDSDTESEIDDRVMVLLLSNPDGTSSSS